MKKILVCMFVLTILTVLVSCGTSSAPTPTVSTPPPPPSDTSPTPELSPDDSIKVDVFWYDYNNAFLSDVRSAMETEFDKTGISDTHYDCNSDQAIQSRMVETAAAQKPDLLIVNIVNTASNDAAAGIVEIAKNAGIPLIFFNREISNHIIDSYAECCFVGTDPDEIGYTEGRAIAEFLLKDDNLSKYDVNGNGEIAYVMLRGDYVGAESLGRSRYSVLEANRLLEGKAKLVPSPANHKSTLYDNTLHNGEAIPEIDNYFLYGNWSGTEAKKTMDTALITYKPNTGDIELIIANNDSLALATIESLNELGYNTGADADKYIPVFGADAIEPAKQAIADGKMTGTVLLDAQDMSSGIVTLALNIADGKSIFEGADSIGTVDEDVNKVRIPYKIFS